MVLFVPTVNGPNPVFVVLTVYLSHFFEVCSMFLAIYFAAMSFGIHRKGVSAVLHCIGLLYKLLRHYCTHWRVHLYHVTNIPHAENPFFSG